ncbi:MAG: hypothetical protein ACYC5M_16915 [Anaerolineae bacterium]
MRPSSLLSPNGPFASRSEGSTWPERSDSLAQTRARTLPLVAEGLAAALLILVALVLLFLGGTVPSPPSSLLGHEVALSLDMPLVSRDQYSDLRSDGLDASHAEWYARRHTWLGRRVQWRGYVVSRGLAGLTVVDMDLPGSSLLGTDVTLSWQEHPDHLFELGQPITFEGRIHSAHRWMGRVWVHLDHTVLVPE